MTPKKKASQQSPKELSTHPVQLPALPQFAEKEEKKEKKGGKQPITMKDVDEMMKKFIELHDDIERKLEEVYEKTGWTANYVEIFLDNPSNFQKDQWERIQRERKALKERYQTKSSTFKKKFQESMKATQKESKRRGKILGARRGWLPMK